MYLLVNMVALLVVQSLPAILGRCHHDLHTLWKKYEFGIGGSKPAQQLIEIEKGELNSNTADA